MTQISHKINRLAFGEYFPGVVNPLDGYVFLPFLSFRSLLTLVFTENLDSSMNAIDDIVYNDISLIYIVFLDI